MAKLIFRKPAEVDFPWEHPHRAAFPAEHRELLHHARLLSELMYGAALLYNLMLAEKAQNQSLVDEHRQSAEEWPDSLDLTSLAVWSFDWATTLAIRRQQLMSPHTLDFCRRWLGIVLATNGKLFDRTDARALVRGREMRLKGARSRFENQRAMDQWSGYAGMFRMNYRWPTVQRFVRDLDDALQNGNGKA